MTDSNQLDQLLNFDPFQEAEKVTGQSYKDHKQTEALGFMLHLANEAQKNRSLEANDDSTYSSLFSTYERIISDIGFEKVLEEFHDDPTRGRTRFCVYWEESRGLLLVLNTYRMCDEETVNGSTFYYNRRPHDPRNFHTSSGSGEKDKDFPDDEDKFIWVGHSDGRIGIRHQIQKMDADGSWVFPWQYDPRIFFRHWSMKQGDRSWSEYSAAGKIEDQRVLSLLPLHVRNMIGKGE